MPPLAVTRQTRTSRPVELQALQLLEGEAEQAAGDVEGGGDDVLELQIGLQLAFVEIELGLAPALGIVAPVPRGEAEIAAVLRDHRLQRLLFARHPAERRLPHGVEQLRHRLRASSPSSRPA